MYTSTCIYKQLPYNSLKHIEVKVIQVTLPLPGLGHRVTNNTDHTDNTNTNF